MMTKTMGQVAYETFNHERPSTELWENLDIAVRANWEEAAAAVFTESFEKLPDIGQATVKVMRSHDYCHFEVQLGTDFPAKVSLHQVDQLRKEAARLVDKAVKQYQVAKKNSERRMGEAYSRQNEIEYAKRIEAIAEPDRTVAQQAQLKAFKDAKWAASREYDYDDAWQDDEN